jgi:hypothetical protein
MRVNYLQAARVSGSMMRATAKAHRTGITRLGKSTVEGAQVVPPNRGKLSVVAQIRGDRTFPGEVVIAEAAEGKQPLPNGEAVEGNRASPSGEVATALLEGTSGAVT